MGYTYVVYDRYYDDVLSEEGYTEVLNYGIAFFRKQCRIEVERKDLMYPERNSSRTDSGKYKKAAAP